MRIPFLKKRPVVARVSSKQQWHAVSVVEGPLACSVAKELAPKRFLAQEAPPLPLANCSSPWRCKCVYRHFADRRASPRREEDRIGLRTPRLGVERRQERGRRSEDC